MGKRTKLIFTVIISVLVIGAGTIFALAKTGKINIEMLADELMGKGVGAATINLTIQNPDGSALRTIIPVTLSGRIDDTNNYPGVSYDKNTDASGKVSFTNVATNYKWMIMEWGIPHCSVGIITVSDDGVLQSGEVWNYQIKMKCEAGYIPPPMPTCTAGQVYDPNTNQCVASSIAPVTSLAHGKVVDSAGNPLGNVSVKGTYSWNYVNWAINQVSVPTWLINTSWSTDPDKNANYKLDYPNGLSAPISLTYSLDGYNSYSMTVAPDNLGRIKDVTLYKSNEAAVKISGQLYTLDSAGQRVGLSGNAIVEDTHATADHADFSTVKTTDANGNYSINLTEANLSTLQNMAIVKGRYAIRDTANNRDIAFYGYYDDNNARTILPGQLLLERGKNYSHIDILINLNQAPNNQTIIMGKVFDKATKAPIEGAFVSLVQAGKYLDDAPGKSDSQGYYIMVVAASQAVNQSLQYQIVASKQGYSDDAAARIGMTLLPGHVYRSTQTDFYLNKCN